MHILSAEALLATTRIDNLGRGTTMHSFSVLRSGQSAREALMPTRLFTKLLLCTLALGISVISVGCGAQGSYQVSVDELLQDAQTNQSFKVYGVIADAPVSSSSGTTFTLCDEANADSSVVIHLAQTSLVEPNADGTKSSGEGLIGRGAIVLGTWDGSIVSGTEIIVKYADRQP